MVFIPKTQAPGPSDGGIQEWILIVSEFQRSQANEVMTLIKEIIPHGPNPTFYWPDDLLKSELWDAQGFVCKNNSQLIGALIYRTLAFQAFEISLIASHPHFSGQGIGTLLLQKLQNQCAVGQAIWLEVHPANLRAIHLYEKLGFHKTGMRPRYYRDGAEAILYSWRPNHSEALS